MLAMLRLWATRSNRGRLTPVLDFVIPAQAGIHFEVSRIKMVSGVRQRKTLTLTCAQRPASVIAVIV